MIMSRIKAWSSKRNAKRQNDQLAFLSSQTNTQYNVDFYNNYCSLIAAGARLKLLEAMFSLNLFGLFEGNACVLESHIIETLGLMPIRAKKWLHLLSCEHFLIKTTRKDKAAYQLSDKLIQLMRSDRWELIQFHFTLWTAAANENLPAALRYGEVNEGYAAWTWPLLTKDQSIWLEGWMAGTTHETISCIVEQIDFDKITNFLDVGGGDATMACAFAAAYPHLKATVYNLPEPAMLARENIESKQLSPRVQVLEGNFIDDIKFPKGFDLILFSRVLFDWNESINRKLLKMAYRALPKNGLLAICETFKENNNDKCLAAEYRYIFIDALQAHVMKKSAEYQVMLKEIGFSILPSHKKEQDFPTYSLLLARK